MKILLLLLTLGCGSTPTTLEVAPGELLTVCAHGPDQGDPVVIVPGLTGCTFGYRKLVPLLHDQGLRTVVIEVLGVGESSRPKGADYTMTAQAERIGAVLDSLGIDQALFVAQGIGGATVFRLAAERPSLVTGLVSIEGAASEDALTANNRTSIKLAKAVCQLGGKGLVRNSFEDGLRDACGDPSWVDRRTVGRYFRGINHDVGAALDVFLSMMDQSEPWAMTPRLPSVEVPVLLLIGTAPHDGEVVPEDFEALVLGLPDLEVLEVDGAGHFIHEEQPWVVAETVAQLVRRLGEAPEFSAGGGSVPGDNGPSDRIQARNPR